jgi:hypothetical protein
MWSDISKYLPQFTSAVLTGLGADGYPYGIRCQARADAAAGVVRLEVSGAHPLVPGPAGILCHSMNEELWDLKSFVVRGKLERDGAALVFRPTKFVPGSGVGNPLKFMMGARRAAAEYLAKRGITRPEVPWDAIRAAKRRAEAAPERFR